MNYFLLVAFISTLSVLCSCASGQGTPPPGGPPDTTAPAIVRTDPPSGTVNYHEQSITIEFSEFVQESNVQQAVVITPIPVEQPEFDWSGRELEIAFRKPLLEDRTYTITLGAEITDLSSNRLGQPFTLRFSTGSVIDSGRIQGSVSGIGKRRTFIFAYTIPADSIRFSDTLRPDSTRPDYITPVGDDGRFSLEGLPAGTFRLFALADESNDQIYTPGVDAFGVATGDLRIDSATVPVTGVSLRLGAGPVDRFAPSLYSASSINRSHTELRFSEPIDTADLKLTNFTITTSAGDAPVTDVWRSATSWLAVELQHGELPAAVEATVSVRNLRDTIGNPIPDSASTIKLTVSDKRDSLPPSLVPMGIDSVKAYTFPDSIIIAFDEAVQISNPSGALAMRDTAGPGVLFRLVRVGPARFTAYPLDSLIGVSRAILEIDLGRFTDLAGDHRDSIVRLPVAVAQSRQSGTLQGTLSDSVAPNASHVVTARMTATGATFTRRVVKNGAWEFAAIPEGEYEVSAFRDNDNNGQYDYGSITPYRPAEAFTTFRGTVRVRPRWVTNKVDLVFGRGTK